MSEDLWELVLVGPNGQVLAQALRLNSEDRAKDVADRWNLNRGNYRLKGHWVVSRLEGSVA